MAQSYVINPDDASKLREVELEMASMRNQILTIESLGQDGMCHICGETGALTREHTPSKKGGNVGPLQSLIVDESGALLPGLAPTSHCRRVVRRQRANHSNSPWV